MKFEEIQATMMVRLWLWIAAGRLTRAIAANT